MGINSNKTVPRYRFLFLVILASLIALRFPIAEASSNWWDAGSKLLNSLTANPKGISITTEEIAAALKDALHIGTENVVGQLGQLDGFNADTAIHIPLPQELQSVKSMLGKVGMSWLSDDLELKLNRAAEIATPKAKKLFWQAISEMTFDDVKTIYNGPNDAATRYFQRKMSPALASEMRPVVELSLQKVGAVQAYDNVMGKYKSLPFVPDVKTDLTNHVVAKGMEGIFYYVAKEEAAIREDPARQTTELLKKVFGAR